VGRWAKMKPEATGTERFITVPVNGVTLEGVLSIPTKTKGVVLFAHGSGSSRLSPRNTFVARVLQGGGFATLLIDLLEEAEAVDRRKVFDIDLLADRLLAITKWLATGSSTQDLPVGYFGASTGAGAALQAAARSPSPIGAVVSRGGRPDLAEQYLGAVKAPTLLIVGGFDIPVIGMNEEALRLLRCPKELKIVPGASHLFEEPGTLEQVADHARDWFQRYLAA
jgi:putative phosphoribosyl transferase